MKITITTPEIKDLERRLAEETDRAEAWELRCEELEQELRDAQGQLDESVRKEAQLGLWANKLRDKVWEQNWVIAQYDDENRKLKTQKGENRMGINEYQELALRTEKPIEDVVVSFRGLSAENVDRLQNGLMGLCGESGEAMDILKKTLFQGHDLDREALAKELGDVAWYLALASSALGYTLERIMEKNIEKLRARYPDGFEVERSVNRREERRCD